MKDWEGRSGRLAATLGLVDTGGSPPGSNTRVLPVLGGSGVLTGRDEVCMLSSLPERGSARLHRIGYERV